MDQSKSYMRVAGSNIKKLRLKKNVGQATVARGLGISTPALSKIETGVTDMNMTRLLQIAGFFKVPVWELLCKESEYLSEELKAIYELQSQIAECDQEILTLGRKLVKLYDQIHEDRFGKY